MAKPTDFASDFIVVGGGTAGLVLARRLSEAGRSVHVLEAGRKIEYPIANGSNGMPFNQAGDLDLKVAVSMPALAFRVLDTAAIDWRDYSASEYGHGKIFMPTGRALGGTSNLNLGVWTRGDARDYDLIAEMNDDQSWRFEHMEKFFKKAESFHSQAGSSISDPEKNQTYGDHGPIHISPISALHSTPGPSIMRFAPKAFEAAGLKNNGYGNTGNSLGFSEISYTIFPKEGGRQSALAYLRGFENPNLYISEGQTVASIIFDGTRAVGVKTADGTIYRANKEVLLCAGALRSPTILQRSGIGDKAHLERCGVPVLQHLPGVGQNLWDHPIVLQKWRVQEAHANGTVDTLAHDPQRVGEELMKYSRDGTGFLASSAIYMSIWKNYADVCRQVLNIEKNREMQTMSQPVRNYLESDRTPHAQLFFANAYPFPPPEYTGCFVSFLVTVATPTSRGYVKIASDDPHVAPLCDPKWLSTTLDRKVMKEAIKTSNEVIMKIMDDEGKPVVVEEADLNNDPPALGFDEESLERKLKLCMSTLYHYAGTCAMAPLESTNPLPVVDSLCRVHGVQGLRVIDASVFPVPISANTQAPVYALAEKMADAILRSYQPRPAGHKHKRSSSRIIQTILSPLRVAHRAMQNVG